MQGTPFWVPSGWQWSTYILPAPARWRVAAGLMDEEP